MAFPRCLAYKAALYCRSKMVPVRMVWLAAIRYGRPAPTRLAFPCAWLRWAWNETTGTGHV
jgi:hypothetical protein